MDRVVSNSRDMIRKGSRSFAAAARLFDPVTRERAYMLYAWCRHCDDVVDGQDLGMATIDTGALGSLADRQARLAGLKDSTRRAMAGEPMTDPVFAAFQRVARDAGIPARYPLELLAGFGMDAEDHHYRNFEDTLLYCYRVAGVVGVMMAYVMGVREPPVLQRAADLGIAFQLTNISRDVADDARGGRCYLPADWLAATGLSRENYGAPGHRPRVATLVARLLDEAERYYLSARVGLRALPFRSAWAIATALGVYREIGEVVRARGAAAWDRRAVVPGSRKLVLALKGAGTAVRAVTLERRAAADRRPRDLWMTEDLLAED